MIINLLLVLILVISKLIDQPEIFNSLYLPFLAYLFLSKKSLFFNKISLKLLFVNFLIIIFSYLFFRDIQYSSLVLILRTISLSVFYLALFGLLPVNFEVFKSFRLSIFISIFAIFFIFDPPAVFRYSANTDGFIGTPGLFLGFSLSGLFPTSFYFAQLLTAYIIYFNSFVIKDNSQKIFSFLPRLANKALLTIILIFTNRKAFLFALTVYPIYSLSLIFLEVIRTKLLQKKVAFAVLISAILVLIGYFMLYFGLREYGVLSILNETIERLIFYTSWAINPSGYTLGETGILSINKFGGYFLYSFTIILLAISLLISLSKIRINTIFNFILAYLYIFLFLFKEAATIFSPSPASLLLCMMVSYLIRTI